MNYKSCYISCPLLKIKLQHFSNFYKFSFLILYPNLRKLLLSLLLALHCGGGKSSQLAHHQLVLSQCRNEKLSKGERNLILLPLLRMDIFSHTSTQIRRWITFSAPACFVDNLKYWWMIQDQKKAGRDFLSSGMFHHSD